MSDDQSSKPRLNSQSGLKNGGQQVYTPHHVVHALAGHDSIVLEGFGGEQAKTPGWLPVNPHLDADTAHEAIVHARSVQQQSLLYRILGLVLAVSLLTGVAVYLAVRVNGHAAGQGATASVQWIPKAMTPNYLSVEIAGTEVQIPLGGLLPSGEKLVGLNADSQTFSTPTQQIALKKSAMPSGDKSH